MKVVWKLAGKLVAKLVAKLVRKIVEAFWAFYNKNEHDMGRPYLNIFCIVFRFV